MLAHAVCRVHLICMKLGGLIGRSGRLSFHHLNAIVCPYFTSSYHNHMCLCWQCCKVLCWGYFVASGENGREIEYQPMGCSGCSKSYNCRQRRWQKSLKQLAKLSVKKQIITCSNWLLFMSINPKSLPYEYVRSLCHHLH